MAAKNSIKVMRIMHKFFFPEFPNTNVRYLIDVDKRENVELIFASQSLYSVDGWMYFTAR